MLIFIFCTRLVGKRLTFLRRNQSLTLTLWGKSSGSVLRWITPRYSRSELIKESLEKSWDPSLLMSYHMRKDSLMITMSLLRMCQTMSMFDELGTNPKEVEYKEKESFARMYVMVKWGKLWQVWWWGRLWNRRRQWNLRNIRDIEKLCSSFPDVPIVEDTDLEIEKRLNKLKEKDKIKDKKVAVVESDLMKWMSVESHLKK